MCYFWRVANWLPFSWLEIPEVALKGWWPLICSLQSSWMHQATQTNAASSSFSSMPLTLCVSPPHLPAHLCNGGTSCSRLQPRPLVTGWLLHISAGAPIPPLLLLETETSGCEISCVSFLSLRMNYLLPVCRAARLKQPLIRFPSRRRAGELNASCLLMPLRWELSSRRHTGLRVSATLSRSQSVTRRILQCKYEDKV